MSRFLRWVEAEKVNSKVESKKWRRLLLRKMCVAFDVSTDGHEEDFFPEMECSGSIVRKDWRIQSNGNVRFHPGGTIEVANAIIQTVLN
ncbi:hypothetical protein Tco_0683501 [Tanacetum coccineum]|uniref:Uncharacterized protein n=1 Tax=Tanacetum coccineum TaxID=301880 RepID=A0ABQ4XUT8_9ASTR